MSTKTLSTRLQVLLSLREHRALRQVARAQGLSLGEWVRRTLRRAMSERSPTSATRKLQTIRQATQHSYPTADIDQMLKEIEQGYLSHDLR